MFATLIALAGGIGLVIAMIWLEKRPREDFNAPLVPTVPVMFAGMLIIVVAVAYLMHLGGVDLPAR